MERKGSICLENDGEFMMFLHVLIGDTHLGVSDAIRSTKQSRQA